MDTPIFSLKPKNHRARYIIRRRENDSFASPGRDALIVRANSHRFPQEISVIATMGRGKDADIFTPGYRLAEPIHCSFLINWKTGIILVQDQSGGSTGVYDNSKLVHNSLRRHYHVVVMDNKNQYLVLGGKSEQRAIFKIVFSLGLEETLEIIQRRISGANADVKRDFLWTFGGQLPQKESKRIRHKTLVKLGRGGFGTVYKTVDLYNGDIVAVKRFKPFWSDESLDREIDALSRFTHPFIIPLYGWYANPSHGKNGRYEMFMPVMQGTLDDLMPRTHSPKETIDIGNTVLLQMLSALDYLACMDFIHRDVKPENILFETDHLGNYVFKLTDFGVSNTIALAESQVGTEKYMAPEMRGDLPQRPKADVWSLFVTMLWVLDVKQFRSLDFKSHLDVQAFVLQNAILNSDIEYMRDMGILNRAVRASAAQMLAKYGRQDLIALGRTERAPDSNRFNAWLWRIWDGRDRWGNYMKRITTERVLRLGLLPPPEPGASPAW